jgi:hypothetical protein
LLLMLGSTRPRVTGEASMEKVADVEVVMVGLGGGLYAAMYSERSILAVRGGAPRIYASVTEQISHIHHWRQ